MKYLLYLCTYLIPFSSVFAQSNINLQNKTIALPNGWMLSPVGKSIPLGDLPLNIAISKSNKWLAVTNNGQSSQTLQLIDVKQEKQLMKYRLLNLGWD